MGRDPNRRSLPLAEWPASDQAGWAGLLEDGDILRDRGAGAHWAPTTRVGIIQSYGHWLGWLQRNRPEDLGLEPANRVKPAVIAAYAAWMGEIVAPLSAALRMQHILRVVVLLAPEQDWSWLKRLARRMESRAVPVRIKKGKLIGAQELYAQGAAMMAEATRSTVPDWRDAQHFRDGLMLCLLASRPLRMRNFSAIEIGRHLCRRGAGFNLRFKGAETKTGQEIDQPVPTTLAPLITRYLEVYRPLLRGRAKAPLPTDLLWISRNGTPMERGTIYPRIITLTSRELGMRINPHMFRDCAATSIATEDPEHVRITMQILGHSTIRTSEKHYNHARTNQAMKRHQDNLLALRRKAVAPPGRRGQNSGR
jgi:integrase/recombinase XerD